MIIREPEITDIESSAEFSQRHFQSYRKKIVINTGENVKNEPKIWTIPQALVFAKTRMKKGKKKCSPQYF